MNQDIWTRLAQEFSSDDYAQKTMPRSRWLLEEFQKLVKPSDGSVLEIGSYSGLNTIALKEFGYDAHAVDLPLVVNDPVLKAPYDRYHVPLRPYQIAEGQRVPYPDNHFAGVILIEVLEHLTINPLHLLNEIKRVLKPGGLLLMTTPNQVRFRGRLKVALGQSMNDDPQRLVKSFRKQDGLDDSGYHWKLYTAEEVKTLAHALGLTVVQAQYLWEPSFPFKNIWDRFFRILEMGLGIFLPSCREWLVFWIKKP